MEFKSKLLSFRKIIEGHHSFCGHIRFNFSKINLFNWKGC